MSRSLSTNTIAAVLTILLLGTISVPCAFGEDKVDVSAQDKIERTRDLLHSESEAATAQSTTKRQPDWQPDGEASLASAGFKMFQGLALCVGFLLIGSWAYRRWCLKEGPVATRTMKVLERMPLGPKTIMYLVEVEGTRILVSAGAEHSTMMSFGRDEPRGGFAISLKEACEKDF